MNGQRLAIGLIILFLCAMCLIQTSMTGCSSADKSAGAAASDSADADSPFFHRTGDEDKLPDQWEPVSEKVLDQIKDMYTDSGVEIQALERSHSGAPGIRCSVVRKDAVPVRKQLLDGMYLLYLTFPGQKVYMVDLGEDTQDRLETRWEALAAFAEAGYSFETGPGETGSFWSILTEGDSSDQQGKSVQTESSD